MRPPNLLKVPLPSSTNTLKTKPLAQEWVWHNPQPNHRVKLESEVSPQAHVLNTWSPVGGTILGGSGNLGEGREVIQGESLGVYPCLFPVSASCLLCCGQCLHAPPLPWIELLGHAFLLWWTETLNQWAKVNLSFKLFLSGTRVSDSKTTSTPKSSVVARGQVPKYSSWGCFQETSRCLHDCSVRMPSVFQCSPALYFWSDLFFFSATMYIQKEPCLFVCLSTTLTRSSLPHLYLHNPIPPFAAQITIWDFCAGQLKCRSP